MSLKMKHMLMGIFAFSVCLASNLSCTYALTTYHSTVEKETITKGVEYIHESKLTGIGLLDVHVITLDLTDDTLSFKGIESAKSSSMRETTREMLKDHGAIAGINTDFFHMSSMYTMSFGPIVDDGELISASANMNKTADEFSSFFIANDNNMFFEYLSMNATFYSANTRVEIGHLNKVDSLVYPIYIDRAYGVDTSVIDKNMKDNAVKIVVEDGVITKISAPAETVAIPENGYLIVYDGNNYSRLESTFYVGDNVTFEITPSVDLDNIDTAFGGGSAVMKNGELATATIKFPTGNHPRSAFGINKDRTQAIFMVVDGRGDSTGTDHYGIYVLMKEYGAYDAMHLDGGGSSTMVAVSQENPDVLEVKNTLSEGSERKVMASAGIFQDRPETDGLVGLKIVPDSTQAIKGKPINFKVYGVDEYENLVDINIDDVYLDAIYTDGVWDNANFTSTNTGKFKVACFYTHTDGTNFGAVTDKITVNSITKLLPSADISLANVGGTSTVHMQATDSNGYTHWISPYTTYEVLNPSIGSMNGLVFTATNTGTTQIKCTSGGQTAYINVKVGDVEYASKPSNTVANDTWRQSITFANDGAYYVNIVGNLVYSGSANINSNTYTTTRNKWKTAVNSNANLGVYASYYDIQESPAITILNWTGGYKFYDTDNTSFVMLTARNNGIRTTAPEQYGYLERDLSGSDNNNIVVFIDKTPSAFSSTVEADYFRGVLSDYAKDGKNVLVVVSSGDSQWVVVQDSVRYISLPNLWKSDGSVNSDFAMLKLKLSNNSIYYDITR